MTPGRKAQAGASGRAGIPRLAPSMGSPRIKRKGSRDQALSRPGHKRCLLTTKGPSPFFSSEDRKQEEHLVYSSRPRGSLSAAGKAGPLSSMASLQPGIQLPTGTHCHNERPRQSHPLAGAEPCASSLSSPEEKAGGRSLQRPKGPSRSPHSLQA